MTRLALDIHSLTRRFAKLFKLNNFADGYVSYRFNSRWYFCDLQVFRTCAKCYRVTFFVSYLDTKRVFEYRSFRSITALCEWLESSVVATVVDRSGGVL